MNKNRNGIKSHSLDTGGKIKGVNLKREAAGTNSMEHKESNVNKDTKPLHRKKICGKQREL